MPNPTKQQLTTKDGEEYKPQVKIAPFRRNTPVYEKWMDNEAFEILSRGGSIAHVCAAIGLWKEKLNEWINPEHELYAESLAYSIKKGLENSESVWSQIGYDGMTGRIKGFNVVAWIFNMKNRFKWQDKHDHEVKQTHEYIGQTDEQLEAQAKRLLGVDDLKAIELNPEDYKEVARDKRYSKK